MSDHLFIKGLFFGSPSFTSLPFPFVFGFTDDASPGAAVVPGKEDVGAQGPHEGLAESVDPIDQSKVSAYLEEEPDEAKAEDYGDEDGDGFA